jgi:4-alpha-glucanotransferase
MTDNKQRLPVSDEKQTLALFKQLLSACGIQDSFVNFLGTTEVIPRQDLLAVLNAQDFAVADSAGELNNEAIRNQLAKLQTTYDLSMLPPVAVYTRRIEDDEYAITLNVPERLLTGFLSWYCTSEAGLISAPSDVLVSALTELSRQGVDGAVYHQLCLPLSLSNLPEGYHKLTVTIAAHAPHATVTTIPLILAPARCYEPAWSTESKRLWGFSVQLYSLCTERSWGMGDFLDLANLIKKSSAHGASYLVLNPLHAGPLNNPAHCSPYSPVDRRRLNPLYIAPELEPEFYSGLASTWLSNDVLATTLMKVARNSEWIDYISVANLKIRVLAMMYQEFENSSHVIQVDRRIRFNEFKKVKGRTLSDYAQWQASQGCTSAGKFSDSVDFYSYLQWLAESQMAACQQQALNLGMAVGLIRDLAVGSDRDSAEVSLSDALFSTLASIGAPPDPVAPQGQNWGLPPMNPVRLRSQAYAHFIELLGSNMEYCGALRIDHVMSLMRLWWCPYEKSGHGAYTLYPADDLFAILRLESQRQRCLIIGEDLGIVPDEVHRHLNDSGIYSNLLFYFEKASANSFKSPQHYSRRALAMLANHDVPTLAAWWDSSDLLLRQGLGLITDENKLLHEINCRQIEKKQILQLLESQWLLPADRFGPDQLKNDMDIPLAAALMRCIARSNAMMVSVQLEDLLLLKLPINIPGTSTEYKNWQRKMPGDFLTALDTESVKPMLESLRVERH